MLKGTRKFLDTYAIIEIMKGNPAYSKFAEATPFSTRTNMVEVAYHLLESCPKEKAENIIRSLRIEVLEIQENQVAKIAWFRKEHSKKKFSYIDCIGYVLAKENSMEFVTGDAAFEGMPNVEFAK